MIIENDLDLIRSYDELGIDRIFLDLELIGKKARQGHLNTVISAHHRIEDIKTIKPVLQRSKLLVRINPVYNQTEAEIENCINYGADILMLPMFKTVDEVKFFTQKVRGRAKTCLLLETAEAMCRIDDILSIKGVDEIHIGLNDLHLALGLDFMFELLTGGVIEYLADKINSAGIPFGFGGVATCQGGLVRGELVLSEHVRLDSSMVILSRSFKAMATENIKTFREEFDALRMSYANLANANKTLLQHNQKTLKQCVDQLCKIKREEA